MDTEVINIVLKDDPYNPTHYCIPSRIKDTPQIHSTEAWPEALPLLQQSDTCSESDSETISSIPESTYIPSIPIVIIAQPRIQQKAKTVSNPIKRFRPTNSNRRYYIHGQRYKSSSVAEQQEFQRIINDTLSVFKQCRVPAGAQPIIFNSIKKACVKTIGQYVPQRDRFSWQQKLV